MTQQRKRSLVGVILLAVGLLAGCTASTVDVPKRAITINNDEAQAAQQAGLHALASGKVTWTENQFSSLLTEGVTENTGKQMPIRAIEAWFEPNNELYLRVLLKEHVLKQGDALELKGAVEIKEHHVVVKFQQAGIGAMSVSEPILTMINTQVDKVLAGANLGVAATVTTETGKLLINLGG